MNNKWNPENLKKLIQEANITLTDLASSTGMIIGTLRSYVSGINTPSFASLVTRRFIHALKDRVFSLE